MTKMPMHVANRLPTQLRELVQQGMDDGIILLSDANAIAYAYVGDDLLRAQCLAALIKKFMLLRDAAMRGQA